MNDELDNQLDKNRKIQKMILIIGSIMLFLLAIVFFSSNITVGVYVYDAQETNKELTKERDKSNMANVVLRDSLEVQSDSLAAERRKTDSLTKANGVLTNKNKKLTNENRRLDSLVNRRVRVHDIRTDE